MRRRFKELATSVGLGWFALAISLGVGVYGAVGLISSSKESGWMWIAIGLFVMLIVSLRVAYQALKARDDASEANSQASSTVIQGGKHYHYYGGPPDEGGPKLG